MNQQELSCDCLVIGSGPGGAITAFVLAQGGRDVLVVEEGRDESGTFLPYSLDELNRYRYGGVSVSSGNSKVFYLEGCCLGGASEINGGLYHRPLGDILDKWKKEYEIRDFGSQELVPFLEMNEKDLDVRTMPSAIGPGSKIIEQGARNLNWKYTETPRMWEYSGSNPLGQRYSMSRSFIPKAKACGARFMLQTKTTKIHLRGGKACEALCVSAAHKTSYKIRFKSVFVSGGAIQTPLLLRHSGLTHNIGDRLKIHLSSRLIGHFEQTASDPRELIPVMQVSEFKPALTLGGSFTSRPFLASWLAGRKDFAQIMQSSSHLGIFYAGIIANAAGRIRRDFLTGEAKLFMNVQDDDMACLGDGLYKLGQLLFAAGAKTIYAPSVMHNDFTTLRDMDVMRHHLLSSGVDLSTMHLFASCPMGENRARCALDSFGRVHGTKNIFVNDASQLPDAPGTNPQALIMALARRNAMHWLKEKIS